MQLVQVTFFFPPSLLPLKVFSGSSSSTKYDPDILKAEISTTRLRVRFFFFYCGSINVLNIRIESRRGLCGRLPSQFSEGTIPLILDGWSFYFC